MQTGQPAPAFELPDQNRIARSLDSLLATGPLVLFFYPAANTPVCTAEACHFRDMAAEFAEVGAACAGISADTVDVQAGFASSQRLEYPLLSDTDGKVADLFGVKRGLLGRLMPVKRHTFVIGTDRRILTVISNELRANVHADRALEFLRARGIRRPPV